MKHLFALIIALLPCGASAQDMSPLATPGAVALMRHALAPGTGDPATFRLEDCSTQRILSDEGRDQARRIGQAIRDAGLRFDYVWTSQWCRARETATLLDVGPVTDQPALNSFFRNRSAADAQRRDLLEALSALPDDAQVLFVTHQVNISHLTGEFTHSGEIIVADRQSDGTLLPRSSILINP